MSIRIDFGGAAELISRLRNQPIPGSRVRTDPDPPVASIKSPDPPELLAAIEEARALLSSGEWVRTRELAKIEAAHGLYEKCLLMNLGDIAEADGGRWVCIPGRSTPILAPGEEKRSE